MQHNRFSLCLVFEKVVQVKFWKMIKVLVFSAIIAVISIISAHQIYDYTAEGVIYNKKVSDDNKIASGYPAPKEKNLDYAFLSVVFINQAQICGGVLIEPEWILTSATCVSEY